MIGNDIIDLKVALFQKKHLDSRYRKKIFQPSEEQLLVNSTNPELFFWRLWSMKEAAYKAHQRNFSLPRILNPIKFKCSIINDSEGIVKTENSQYNIQSEINEGYIYSYVITDNEKIDNRFYQNARNDKETFLADFSEKFNLKTCETKLSKDRYGIPSISIKSKPNLIPISLSHHGNFSAFAFPLIKS